MADEPVDPTTPVTPPVADAPAAEAAPVAPSPDEGVVEAELVEPTDVLPTFAPAEPAYAEPAAPAYAEPVAPVEEPVAGYAEPGPGAPQYVVVEAPREPRRHGNRGTGSLLAVAGAVIFGALLVGATYLLGLASGADGFAFVQYIKFYLPIVIFLIAFVLLVLIVNRGAWWTYILGSLVVGAVVYVGTAAAAAGVDQLSVQLGQLQAADVSSIGDGLGSPFVIVAAVLAREVALWWGSLIAHRGRRMTAKNRVAREDFDRQLADFHAKYGASSPV